MPPSLLLCPSLLPPAALRRAALCQLGLLRDADEPLLFFLGQLVVADLGLLAEQGIAFIAHIKSNLQKF